MNTDPRHDQSQSNPPDVDQTNQKATVSFHDTLFESPSKTHVDVKGEQLKIGDYVVLNRLGSGGMGVVYRARQLSANRIVALKVIRPERLGDLTDTKRHEWLERFRSEAQAAAKLDHDNIVTVFDVGESDGMPYYSMQYIEGSSLAELVSEGPLENRTAATLLEQIARAVQHANNAHILHRDLKPQNILIDENDRPYVADFGLAKWLDQDETKVTHTGTAIGTPSYMSPEQALDASRCTALSDVYSIGATLYDILTGRPPFRGTSPMETLQQVLNMDPVSPCALNPNVDPDLETITLKCIAKEPPRRYESAGELADDLQRYLNGEPIRARSIGVIHRSLRWSQRHPAAATAVATILVALVSICTLSGAIWNSNVSLTGAVTELRAANQAEVKATNRAEIKREEAEMARDQNKRQLQYMVNAFRSPDPLLDGRSITVAEVLEQAESLLAQHFQTEPLIRAEVLQSIGRTYVGLSLPRKAVTSHEQSLNLFKQHLGERHESTLFAMSWLAEALAQAGELDRASLLHEETLSIMDQTMGPNHVSTLIIMRGLAETYRLSNRLSDAQEVAENAIERLQATLGAQHDQTYHAKDVLAMVYTELGEPQKSVPMLEKSLQWWRSKHGDNYLGTLSTVNNLALAYRSQGNWKKALQLLEDTEERMRTTLGEDHSSALIALNNLAEAYQSAGRTGDAIPLIERVLSKRRIKLGSDHHLTIAAMGNLSNAYISEGYLDKALTLIETTLDLTSADFGRDHLLTISRLASVYESRGDFDKAMALVQRALKGFREALGEDHPITLGSMTMVGSIHLSAGRVDEAILVYEKVMSKMKTKLNADHPDALRVSNDLATAYHKNGELSKAIPLYEKILNENREKQGNDHPATLSSMANLATAYYHLGQLEKAIPLMIESSEQKRKTLGKNHPSTLYSMSNLAAMYLAARQLDRAIPLMQETLKGRQERLGDDHPDTLMVMNNLAWAYRTEGKLNQAIDLQQGVHEKTRNKLGEQHPDALLAMFNLGTAYEEANRLKTSEQILRDCLKIRQRSWPDDWWTFEVEASLGRVLQKQMRHAEAEPLLLHGYGGLKSRFSSITPSDRHRFMTALISIVDLYENWERPDEMNQWIERLVAYLRATLEKLPDDSSQQIRGLESLGLCLLKMKKYAEAEHTLNECLLICERKTPNGWRCFYIKSMLGSALTGLERFEQAEQLLVEAYEGLTDGIKEIPGQSKSRISTALKRLIKLYDAWSMPEESEKWRQSLSELESNQRK